MPSSPRRSDPSGSSKEERLRLLNEIAALREEKRRLLAKVHAGRFAPYRSDPVGWIHEILRERLWAKQQEIARALHELRRVVVSSCFASGKTFLAARLVAHWISTDPGAIAITTASVGRAVKGQLWGEIRIMAERARRLSLLQEDELGELVMDDVVELPPGLLPRNPEWNIAPGNFALGFSTNDPNKFAGWHGGRVLVVLDEAEGVPEDLWDIMEGQLSSADVAVLAIGNPDPAGIGGGYQKAAQSALWHHLTISAFDTPNLVAGDDSVNPQLVTGRWVEERRTEWGEGHPLWICKVLGQFPQGDAARNVVPLQWFERNVDRPGPWPVTAEEPEGGLDIARFGTDFSAIAIRQGQVLGHLDRIHGFDGTEVGDWTIERMERFGCEILKGDSSGMGGPVLDYIRLRRPSWQVHDVNAGASAKDPEHFVRCRDELWWGVRIRCQENRIMMPTASLGTQMIAILKADLTPVTYKMPFGRVSVEPKDGWPGDKARRKRPSPDVGDAVCLSFYVPPAMEFLGTA